MEAESVYYYLYNIAIVFIIYYLLIIIADRILEFFIYKPKLIDFDKYQNLNTKTSNLIDLYTINNEMISAVEIYPEPIDIPKDLSDDNFSTEFIDINIHSKDLSDNKFSTESINIHPTKCIIYTHGNSGNITGKMRYLRNISNQLQAYVIAYDYVGYGLSEQKRPTEQRCYDSLTCVVEYVINIKKISKDNICLVGRSLGTGVVVDYAYSQSWTTPIILVSPYKSICTIKVNTRIPIPFDKYTSYKKIEKLKCPIKIFHGDKDTLIKISHGIDLYRRITNKHFEAIWLSDVGHTKIMKHVTADHYRDVFIYKN